MGILTKKLHILKTDGTKETCNIYTTPTEVGGCPCIALEVDGQKGYVKLGSITDANATHLRVEKGGVIYAAWKQAASVPSVTYVDITITQSANQTIHVYTPQKNGGTDHTSSFRIPKGTTYEAEVIAHSGYTAGTLNANRTGTFTSNTQFTATTAHENTQSNAAQMVVGQFVKTFDADYEYRGYGFSRSDSWLREDFGSLTKNPINGVTIYTIYRAEIIVQGANTGVEFAIDTDKPCKVTIGNDTYTVYKRVGSVYEYKTTGLSSLNWVDGQQFAIKVDLL